MCCVTTAVKTSDGPVGGAGADCGVRSSASIFSALARVRLFSRSL